jgi:hypothetical protein
MDGSPSSVILGSPLVPTRPLPRCCLSCCSTSYSSSYASSFVRAASSILLFHTSCYLTPMRPQYIPCTKSRPLPTQISIGINAMMLHFSCNASICGWRCCPARLQPRGSQRPTLLRAPKDNNGKLCRLLRWVPGCSAVPRKQGAFRCFTRHPLVSLEHLISSVP